MLLTNINHSSINSQPNGTPIGANDPQGKSDPYGQARWPSRPTSETKTAKRVRSMLQLQTAGPPSILDQNGRRDAQKKRSGTGSRTRRSPVVSKTHVR
jgi:hypothetical protein